MTTPTTADIAAIRARYESEPEWRATRNWYTHNHDVEALHRGGLEVVLSGMEYAAELVVAMRHDIATLLAARDKAEKWNARLVQERDRAMCAYGKVSQREHDCKAALDAATAERDRVVNWSLNCAKGYNRLLHKHCEALEQRDMLTAERDAAQARVAELEAALRDIEQTGDVCLGRGRYGQATEDEPEAALRAVFAALDTKGGVAREGSARDGLR